MKISVKSGNADKIHIYIDDEYRMSVDSDFWYSEKWHSLKEIDDEELTALENAVSFRRAYNAGLNLLSYRDHGRNELKRKLVSKKYPADAAEYAVDRLCELGLINDFNYAEMLSDELIRKKGYSPKRVRQELLSRGISREICEQISDNLDFSPELSIIDLLQKKYSRYLATEKGRKKVFNSLLRLGYSYSEINSALRKWDNGEIE